MQASTYPNYLAIMADSGENAAEDYGICKRRWQVAYRDCTERADSRRRWHAQDVMSDGFDDDNLERKRPGSI